MSSGKPPFSGNGHGGGDTRSAPGGSRKPAPPMERASPPPTARAGGREPSGRTVKCPQCGKPARWEGNPDRPFCSERCRLMDLGRWADGSYAIPDKKVPDKDEE